MKPNPLHFYCFVDKRATSAQERLTDFMEEMERLYPCKFTIEKIDGDEIQWVERNKKMYASDAYVKAKAKEVHDKYGTDVDAVKWFVANRNWEQGDIELRGFKLGRIFSSYYATFTRYRKDWDGTAEHETLHFIDEFVKANTGVRLETLFKDIEDFDSDIVHSVIYWKQNNYDYDEVWQIISDHISNAVFKRRNEQNTLMMKIRLLKQIIELLTKQLGLMSYKSHSIPEIEIRKMPTTKKYKRYGLTSMVGHIDLGTEAGTIDEILNGTRSASYNFYVPRHAKYIVEFVPLEESAWHAGVIHEPDQSLLGGLLGGADKVITSGEPNRWAGGGCYEGRTTTTEPTQGQIELAHKYMMYKKKEHLPWFSHWQITSYKPRVVSKFVDGINALINNK